MSSKSLNKVVILSILYPFLLLRPILNSISKICWFEVSVLQEVSLKKHLRKVKLNVCVCFIEFEKQYLTLVQYSKSICSTY
jgi:hypothetical protein